MQSEIVDERKEPAAVPTPTGVNPGVTPHLDPDIATDRTTDAGACCAPLLAAPLSGDEATDLARAFKALADPVRLRLLSLIASAADGEACSCDLEAPVGKSQPTVSHHLSVLADAGLVTKRKAGRWVMCRVVPGRLDALRDALAPA